MRIWQPFRLVLLLGVSASALCCRDWPAAEEQEKRAAELEAAARRAEAAAATWKVAEAKAQEEQRKADAAAKEVERLEALLDDKLQVEADAKSAPKTKDGDTAVKGSLSKEVIRRVVRSHIHEVTSCYERELANRPTLTGRVVIKFIIMGTGAVQMAAVAESTVGDPIVEDCIARAVRRWIFSAPDGGGVVIVTYPFELAPAEVPAERP